MRKTRGIYKRKDGRYEFRYRKGLSEDGRVIYGSIYSHSKEEMEKYVADIEKETEVDQPFSPELNLLIIGAGSHGHDVKELAESLRIFRTISFLDDKVESEEVIGKCKDASLFVKKYGCAFVAIGDNRKRKKFANFLEECGFRMPSIISPSASVSVNAQIGNGVVIFPGSTISNSIIGDYSILESNSFVGRGATLGKYSRLDCGSSIPKMSNAPDSTWLKNGETYKRKQES